MSERFFDNLARTLASPMPRRRAVRALGAAVVVAILPGLRPRSALARSNITCIPGKTEICSKNAGTEVCMPIGGTCCVFGPITGFPGGLLVGCGKGTRCGTGEVGDRCVCDEHLDADGNCVKCDEEDKCGKNCCKKGQYCASPNRSLCCGNATDSSPKEDSCFSSPTKGTCCKAGTVCTHSVDGKETKCCRPNEVVRGGRCACRDPKQKLCGGKECCDKKGGEVCTNGTCCPKGKIGCGGTDCCEKGEVCSKGKCCPKGKVNCGGKCCARVDCCGKTCCTGDKVCANGTCCPPSRGFGKGRGARCCPPGTIPTSYGVNRGCCPPNDPACCEGDSDFGEVTCPGGKTCVTGVCTKL